MSDELHARIDALEARIAILEAERAKRPQMVYNWHLKEPPRSYRFGPTDTHAIQYEHFIDPSMRETRNG